MSYLLVFCMCTLIDVHMLLWTQPSVGDYRGPEPHPSGLIVPNALPITQTLHCKCKHKYTANANTNAVQIQTQYADSQHNFGQLSQTQWSSARTTLGLEILNIQIYKYCSCKFTNTAYTNSQILHKFTLINTQILALQYTIRKYSSTAFQYSSHIDRDWNRAPVVA